MGQFMSVFRINMAAATVLAALSSPVFAAQTADLETVHIKGQRSYNAIATEKNGDYSSLKAATWMTASMPEFRSTA
ncbi:TPA: TonB-dependent receptor [Neisseria gonorrhoeae]